MWAWKQTQEGHRWIKSPLHFKSHNKGRKTCISLHQRQRSSPWSRKPLGRCLIGTPQKAFPPINVHLPATPKPFPYFNSFHNPLIWPVTSAAAAALSNHRAPRSYTSLLSFVSWKIKHQNYNWHDNDMENLHVKHKASSPNTFRQVAWPQPCKGLLQSARGYGSLRQARQPRMDICSCFFTLWTEKVVLWELVWVLWTDNRR